MSPGEPLLPGEYLCFPRASGDEPADEMHDTPRNVFSPRERG